MKKAVRGNFISDERHILLIIFRRVLYLPCKHPERGNAGGVGKAADYIGILNGAESLIYPVHFIQIDVIGGTPHSKLRRQYDDLAVSRISPARKRHPRHKIIRVDDVVDVGVFRAVVADIHGYTVIYLHGGRCKSVCVDVPRRYSAELRYIQQSRFASSVCGIGHVRRKKVSYCCPTAVTADKYPGAYGVYIQPLGIFVQILFELPARVIEALVALLCTHIEIRFPARRTAGAVYGHAYQIEAPACKRDLSVSEGIPAKVCIIVTRAVHFFKGTEVGDLIKSRPERT